MSCRNDVGEHQNLLDAWNAVRDWSGGDVPPSLLGVTVTELTEVRIGPLSSVDDRFAHDEGEDDRTRTSWLEAHIRFFERILPPLGIDFYLEMPTIFQRFDVLYREESLAR